MAVTGKCLIAAAAITAVATSPAFGKELRYGTYIPSISALFKETVKTFDEIKTATNGSLTFKIFPNSEVVNTRTVFRGIASGIVDMGHVLFVVQPSELPHASIAAQAVAFVDTPLAGSGAVAEFHMVTCEECRSEFDKTKVMPLGGEGAARYILMCSKEYKSVDDLKGARVRAVGTMARWSRELGMIPTQIESPEVLQSMERGVIQCTLGLPVVLRAYGLMDAVKFIIDTKKGGALGAGTFWINTQTWKGLAAAHKKAMLDALPGHIYRTTAVGVGSEAEVVLKQAVAAGIKVTDGGPDYAAKWAAFRAKERATLIDLAEKRKVKDAEKFVDSMIGVFETWNRLMAGKEGDQAYFENLIRSRVIDKSPLTKASTQ